MEIKAFVTNLGKYNEGYLIGEWVRFPIDKDNFEKVLDRISINDMYEEWFITDWDCGIDLSEELGNYPLYTELNGVAECFGNWDDEYATAVYEVFGIDAILNSSQSSYMIIPAEDDIDIGEYFINETGMDVPDWLIDYIDYEAYGRDVRLSSDGGFSSNGYYVSR